MLIKPLKPSLIHGCGQLRFISLVDQGLIFKNRLNALGDFVNECSGKGCPCADKNNPIMASKLSFWYCVGIKSLRLYTSSWAKACIVLAIKDSIFHALSLIFSAIKANLDFGIKVRDRFTGCRKYSFLDYILTAFQVILHKI